MLIAQLSDPHLQPAGMLLAGSIDANALFEAAVRQVGAFAPRPDVVLLTGDIADHGAAPEYAVARSILASLPMPVLALPGNHDEREAFRTAFADQVHLPSAGPLHFCIDDRGPLRIIGLDVTVPGEHHGLIDEAAAEWLERTLAAAPARPTLIMMHQPPFACGIPYVDDYWCREGERLAAILARCPAVERVACGHVHRMMQVRFAGTVLCTAPSTSSAIALRLDPAAEPASFLEPPAFLLHDWRPGTGLVTHLVPIGAFPGPLGFA